MMITLPGNRDAAAAASGAVNGHACGAVRDTNEMNGTSNVNGSDEVCFTPVTDPDSLALLAAMHEANRFTAHSSRNSCFQ